MRICRQKPTAVLAGGIFELVGLGGFTAAALRLPQLDLQLATPPYSNGCYSPIDARLIEILLVLINFIDCQTDVRN
ncbi:hypothetical protein T07_7774 [Trichinella nelsoni]|uniref:Uncharacterized protein n=1 Tax=Trichinella nelsoni TaxID=6336 RepID=A0A0V0RUW6_9BILA|nr:hypothetical protein T07_7774 [Trichinella nelsoni]